MFGRVGEHEDREEKEKGIKRENIDPEEAVLTVRTLRFESERFACLKSEALKPC